MPAKKIRHRAPPQLEIGQDTLNIDSMTITDSPVEKCILNSDIKKEVLYQTGKTMEPFFEVIQKLDMMAADAVNIALDAERMANATSKLEHAISGRLGLLEEYCRKQVQDMNDLLSKLHARLKTIQQQLDSSQAENQANVNAAIQNTAVIQTSQRECIRAVDELTDLLRYVLSCLPSETSARQVKGLLLPTLLNSPSPGFRQSYGGSDNTNGDETDLRGSTLPENHGAPTTSDEFSELQTEAAKLHDDMKPTPNENLESIDMQHGGDVELFNQPSPNDHISRTVRDILKQQKQNFKESFDQTSAHVNEAATVSSRTFDIARYGLSSTVTMSRRLQHAEDTIRTALDPLGHFIHTLEEDIKIFERKSEVVMDHSESIFAVNEDMSALLSAQKQCTQLVVSLGNVLLQAVIYGDAVRPHPKGRAQTKEESSFEQIRDSDLYVDPHEEYENLLPFPPGEDPEETTSSRTLSDLFPELLKQDNTVDQYRDPQNQNLDDPSNFQIHADVLMELPEQDDAAWGGLQSELPSAPTNSRTLADLCPELLERYNTSDLRGDLKSENTGGLTDSRTLTDLLLELLTQDPADSWPHVSNFHVSDSQIEDPDEPTKSPKPVDLYPELSNSAEPADLDPRGEPEVENLNEPTKSLPLTGLYLKSKNEASIEPKLHPLAFLSPPLPNQLPYLQRPSFSMTKSRSRICKPSIMLVKAISTYFSNWRQSLNGRSTNATPDRIPIDWSLVLQQEYQLDLYCILRHQGQTILSSSKDITSFAGRLFQGFPNVSLKKWAIYFWIALFFVHVIRSSSLGWEHDLGYQETQPATQRIRRTRNLSRSRHQFRPDL